MPTKDDVLAAGKRIGFAVPPEHVEDYRKQFEGVDSAVQAVLECPGMSSFWVLSCTRLTVRLQADSGSFALATDRGLSPRGR